MPFSTLPFLIAPAMAALIFIPLIVSAPPAYASRAVAAAVSYQAMAPKAAPAHKAHAKAHRPAPSQSRSYFLARPKPSRPAGAAFRPSQMGALCSLQVPFPNAPRAP